MRPLRQIDDRAEVLTEDQIVFHRPERPSWLCACGNPWPCAKLRGHLLATMAPQELGLSMAAYYRDARRELDGEVPAVSIHARLFGWVHEGSPRRPDGWRFPGGPW